MFILTPLLKIEYKNVIQTLIYFLKLISFKTDYFLHNL